MTTATMTISDRDRKTLEMIEAQRQDAIRLHGIDVRTLSKEDVWNGHPLEVRKALGLELNRRRFVAKGKIPAGA